MDDVRRVTIYNDSDHLAKTRISRCVEILGPIKETHVEILLYMWSY